MTDGIDICIGDVVMYGERMEPPRFQQVTTEYECRRWAERQPEIAAVLRPVWRRKKSNPAALPAPVVSAEQIECLESLLATLPAALTPEGT